MKKSSPQIRQYEQRLKELKKMLEPIGFVCRGSLQTRSIECGKPKCRCHTSPEYHHGPYHYWTRKVRAKTVGRTLSDRELNIIREAIENSRILEQIVKEMYELSAHALELIAQEQTAD